MRRKKVKTYRYDIVDFKVRDLYSNDSGDSIKEI